MNLTAMYALESSSEREKVLRRFWKKVDKTGDCWLWTAAVNWDGYGSFSIRRQMQRAHRVSYEIAHGRIPEGLMIDHLCHTLLCVNPAHLRATTAKVNQENRAGANRPNATGVRGVALWENKYLARVGHNYKVHFVGRFDTLEEAEYAVKMKRKELHTGEKGKIEPDYD